MSDRVELEVVASKNEQSFQSIEQDLKQLEKPRAAEIALNLSRAKTELAELKKLQKEALKVENFDLAEKIGQQVEIASKKVTTINRQLTNFQRTGNENMSVLGQMFKNVNEQIIHTEKALLKVGKNTEGIELLRKKAEELSSGLKSGNVSIEQYQKGLKQLGAEAEKIAKSIQESGNSVNTLSGIFTKIGGFIGGFAALQGIGGSILNLGDKLEQASISFEVMLGSGEKAQKMLTDLSNFAQKTPFELQGIRDSTKQLLAMGIPAEKMIKTLKVLGDISAGTGAPLQQIAYAYGQVATAGVATTQDMNQLVNAGIPIWKELGKVVGVTAAEVKKMVENREITFEQVEEAMTQMTEKGGQFANLMDAQSKTLKGQWSQFKDQLAASGEKIGTLLLPVMKWLTSTLSSLASVLDSTGGKITAFAAVIGVVAGGAIKIFIGSIASIITAVGSAIPAVGGLAIAVNSLIWPLTLLVGAIGLVGGAIWAHNSAIEEQKQKLAQMEEGSKSLTRQLEDEKEAIKKLKEAYEQGKITKEEYKQKLEETEKSAKSLREELERLAKAPEKFEENSKKIKKLGEKNDVEGLRKEKITIEAQVEFDQKQLEETKQNFKQAMDLFYQESQDKITLLEAHKKYLKSVNEESLAYKETQQKIYNLEAELTARKWELTKGLQDQQKEYENIINLGNKNLEQIQDELQAYSENDAILKNLKATKSELEDQQTRLTEQYEQGKITLEEYNQKTAENDEKIQEVIATNDEYKKGLEIVQDNQLGYIDKIHAMNGLRLDPSLFNALIAKLIEAERQAIATARAVALALQTKLQAEAAAHPNVYSQQHQIKLNRQPSQIDRALNGHWKALNKPDQLIKGVNAQLDAKIAHVESLERQISKTEAEINSFRKDVPKSGGKGGGGGGKKGKGGGGGGKSKEDKEVEKREKDLAKARTNAYKDATRRVEKFNDVIKNTNKKLEEQKKKLEDIKKEAKEAIKDLQVSITDNRLDFHEKIAKRYNEIIKEAKEEFKNLGFGEYSDAEIAEKLQNKSVSGGNLDKLQKELDIINEKVNKEDLELALKNENLSETEKITYEYERQEALLNNSLKMQKALQEGRYITGQDGKLQFFDENGNILKALERDQEKEFESAAQKIQNLANEELKISQEKTDKIRELLQEFENERRTLNEEYFNDDKEIRLQQQAMMEEFFAAEIGKMKELSDVATIFKDRFGNKNTTGTTNHTQDKTENVGGEIEKYSQTTEKITKTEQNSIKDRTDKNAELMKKYHDLMSDIESGITRNTETEINKRLSLYHAEEQKLTSLINKRLQAGYAAIGGNKSIQNISNIVNNSPNISVNATSSGNLDINSLANVLAKKVQNISKGIK